MDLAKKKMSIVIAELNLDELILNHTLYHISSGVQCSGEQCPKNCNGQGKCEGGKCVCFQGFSGPDCSGKTCPSNCNKKGKCVKGKCVCQTGFTGLDCSKGK